jgi:hypothetical protein
MLKNKKYIYVKQKALSKEQCNAIINFIDNSSNILSLKYYHGISSNPNSEIDHLLMKVLRNNLEKYIQTHKFLGKLNNPWGIDKNYNFQKYFPGECYYSEHMEHGKSDYDCKRLIAWMFYLNDVKNGGETYWPQQNFKKTARSGDLCIWPACWTHSHYGIASKKETKYIITGWCSFV